jgi:hypothetical protein
MSFKIGIGEGDVDAVDNELSLYRDSELGVEEERVT